MKINKYYILGKEYVVIDDKLYVLVPQWSNRATPAPIRKHKKEHKFLSDKDWAKILRALNNGESAKVLAKKYKISTGSIYTKRSILKQKEKAAGKT